MVSNNVQHKVRTTLIQKAEFTILLGRVPDED